MKIRELPILARIDKKTKKRAAAKKCCGWEKPAICTWDITIPLKCIFNLTFEDNFELEKQ